MSGFSMSYRQPLKSLRAGSGSIGFSVLDYSGCSMENGLQSSKTECGESSQEAITEGGGEMARWDKDNGVASGSGQRSIEKVK